MNALVLCSTLLILHSASGLVAPAGRSFDVRSQVGKGTVTRSTELCMSSSNDIHVPTNKLNRRSFLSIAGQSSAFFAISNARADDSKGKVVVFGGSGWVGAHACQILSAQGVEVVSVSRSSPSDQAAKVKTILGSSLPIDYQSLNAGTDDLATVLKGASAVVSLVGIAPGGKNQREGNGLVNVRIADAAKAAGIGRFVYVSVSSEMSNGPAKFLLGDYFKGKKEAESAVVKDFGTADSLVLKPSIIAGGPPGEFRPPGPPGMSPVPVDVVAKAVAAGALGRFSGSIDGNDAIVASVN